VFGAGAGESATDSGDAPAAPEDPAQETPTETPAPPADGGTSDSPALDQAVTEITEALDALETAQRNGDFAAQGQALADLQAAVDAYQAAQAAASPGG
jgi:hypothetical protein